jgi:hypothetical protein
MLSSSKNIIFFPQLDSAWNKKVYVELAGERIEPRPISENTDKLIDSVNSFLLKSHANSVLAIYFPPEIEIANIISAGKFHEGVIDEVLSRFELFIGLVRKHPRSVLLVDYKKAERSPKIASEALIDRSWGELHGLDGGEASVAVDDVALALARLAMLECPALRRIGAELQAREIAAFPDLYNQPLSFRAMGDLAAIKDENRAVVESLFSVQDDLQNETRKREALEAALKNAQDRHLAEQASRQAEIDRLKRETDRQARETSERERDMAVLADEAKNLRAALTEVYSSTSWRLSAPIRWMRAAANLILRRPPRTPGL